MSVKQIEKNKIEEWDVIYINKPKDLSDKSPFL